MDEISVLFAVDAEQFLISGFPREAAELCERGLELYPDYSAAYAVLAKAYKSLGEDDKAEATLQKADSRFGDKRIVERTRKNLELPDFLSKATAQTIIEPIDSAVGLSEEINTVEENGDPDSPTVESAVEEHDSDYTDKESIDFETLIGSTLEVATYTGEEESIESVADEITDDDLPADVSEDVFEDVFEEFVEPQSEEAEKLDGLDLESESLSVTDEEPEELITREAIIIETEPIDETLQVECNDDEAVSDHHIHSGDITSDTVGEDEELSEEVVFDEYVEEIHVSVLDEAIVSLLSESDAPNDEIEAAAVFASDESPRTDEADESFSNSENAEPVEFDEVSHDDVDDTVSENFFEDGEKMFLKAVRSSGADDRASGRLKSTDLSLIPGLEYSPLRTARKLHNVPMIYRDPGLPDFDDAQFNFKYAGTNQIESEPGSKVVSAGERIDALAARLEGAVIPKTVEVDETDNDAAYEEPTGITGETMAFIYESQGAWPEALEAYRRLIHAKPERAAFYLEKIESIESKIELKTATNQ